MFVWEGDKGRLRLSVFWQSQFLTVFEFPHPQQSYDLYYIDTENNTPTFCREDFEEIFGM